MDFLDNPTTEEQLKATVSKGACNKAPGINDICLEFFNPLNAELNPIRHLLARAGAHHFVDVSRIRVKVTWGSIKDDKLALFDQMNFDGRIMEQQKYCIVVSLTKTDISTTLADYTFFTLPNTDFKTLARIIANRLRHTISDVLYPSQYCGVQGNTIFDAVATISYDMA
jgi:hypothetical protein